MVIKSFWLLLSLELEHDKTSQKISNYDRVSLVTSSVRTCAGRTADVMNRKVAQKPQGYTLVTSLLCFMTSGVRKTCDLETVLVPGFILMNTPLGVI